LNFTIILILQTELHYMAGLLFIHAVIYFTLIYLNQKATHSLLFLQIKF